MCDATVLIVNKNQELAAILRNKLNLSLINGASLALQRVHATGAINKHSCANRE